MPETGSFSVVLMKLSDQRATSDAYEWNSRTMQVAHDYVWNNFDSLCDGDVVDVEFILGITKTAKVSERETAPL